VPPAAQTRPKTRPVPVGRQGCPVTWVPGHPDAHLLWRNLLVTNDEFAAFLNEMAAEGLPNCMDGCYLLAIEMPHERGGRLHYNPHDRWWTVSPGFGARPAYWVTWTGAAAYAARHGARLPSRAEMIAEASQDGLAVTNHGYQDGDTVPSAEPGRGLGEIHHLVGNLQVWCCDGPAAAPSAPSQRWLHGAAWNTPGTLEEIHRPRGRHLSGASRGVGVRLVRDCAGQHAATRGTKIFLQHQRIGHERMRACVQRPGPERLNMNVWVPYHLADLRLRQRGDAQRPQAGRARG
jgi:hypothetical protein